MTPVPVIAYEGVDHRGELGSLLTSIAQVLFKKYIRSGISESIDFTSSEDLNALSEAFKFFLRGAQDPKTGYSLRCLAELGARLAALEALGQNLYCSQQIFLEAKSLHRYTAKWDELADKLDRLELSLADPEQGFAARQLPTDGLWGACYDAWFMRIGATVSGLADLASRGEKPRYRIRPGIKQKNI